MNAIETLTDLYGHDLAAEQFKLEAESYELGAKRFEQAMQAKAERGEGADTRVSRPLIADMVPKMSAKIQAFIDESNSGKPGKKAAALRHLQSVDIDRTSFMALRTLFNLSMRTEVQLVQLSEAIGRDVEDEARFGKIRDRDQKWYSRVIAPAIAKRSSDHFRRAYARAVEVSMKEADELPTWDSWTAGDRVAVGLKCVELMIELGIASLHSTNPGNPKLHKNLVVISDECAQWLASRQYTLAGIQPIHAPCVVPPKPWTSLVNGGYWSEGKSPTRFVKGLSRAQRRRYNDVDLQPVFDAVNAIQNTPWHINKKVLEVAKELSGWKTPPVDEMVPAEVTAKPERPDGIDDEPDTLKQWKRMAALSYRKETARRSRRGAMEFTLLQAEKFSQYERIWFPYNLDFRSRVYAIPTFCPQGTDLTKGLLKLADPVPMGETGAYWLKMHLANTYGLDKEPMDVRIKWAEDNSDLVRRIAGDPLDYVDTWANADSPFCFLASCFEWAEFLRVGPGYCCGIAVAFDGSCSGIQHFSAMLQDHHGGAAVNLVPSERPSDIYRIVADKVNALLDRDIAEGDPDSVTEDVDEDTGEITQKRTIGTRNLAIQWRTYGVTRSVTKRSVMTLPYGSKEFGFADQLLEDIIRPATEKQGVDVFPDQVAAARYMAKLIWVSLGTTVVAAVGAMAWLQKAASALASQGMPAHWVTPVGFPVWQEYRKRDQKRVDTIICGSLRITMKVSGSYDENRELDRHKQVNGISPNFVHSMDASHMMLTVLGANRAGVEHFACIHDSFGTCPGNAGRLFVTVREEFVAMYKDHDVIQGFYETFESLLTDDSREKIPELPAKGSLKLESIKDSLYCFC